MFGFEYQYEFQIDDPQENYELMDNLGECPGQCSFRGFCKEKECFCEMGFTGERCEISLLEIVQMRKNHEKVQSKIVFYCFMSFLSGLFIAFMTKSYVINFKKK